MGALQGHIGHSTARVLGVCHGINRINQAMVVNMEQGELFPVGFESKIQRKEVPGRQCPRRQGPRQVPRLGGRAWDQLHTSLTTGQAPGKAHQMPAPHQPWPSAPLLAATPNGSLSPLAPGAGPAPPPVLTTGHMLCWPLVEAGTRVCLLQAPRPAHLPWGCTLLLHPQTQLLPEAPGAVSFLEGTHHPHNSDSAPCTGLSPSRPQEPTPNFLLLCGKNWGRLSTGQSFL